MRPSPIRPSPIRPSPARLSPHIKKLIGAIVMLIWLPVYAVLAMGVAYHVLPGAAWYTAFTYYAVAGMLWAVPIGLMLPWMYREPAA